METIEKIEKIALSHEPSLEFETEEVKLQFTAVSEKNWIVVVLWKQTGGISSFIEDDETVQAWLGELGID